MPLRARRFSVLTTAAISAVALTTALVPVVSAIPAGALGGRASGDPSLHTRPYLEAAATDAGVVSVEVEELRRTDTSVTLEVTLPPGVTTTRDGVLQAYTETGGRRISRLSPLTDPAAGFGADHTNDYDTQYLELELPRILRDTFSVDGATPISWAGRDHLEVHEGQNSVEITFRSSLDAEQLAMELRWISVGESDEERKLLADHLLESRLALPLDATWTYGDRLPVERSPRSLADYVNVAHELTESRTGTRLDSTLQLTHPDGTELNADRILTLEAGDFRDLSVRELGGRTLREVFGQSFPPPLQHGKVRTEVTGARHERDGFYMPEPGATTVTARTTGSGPKTEAQARTLFTEWATDTCGAGMNTAIPGYPAAAGGPVMTWERYIDAVAPDFGRPDPDAAALIYTDIGALEVIRAETEENLAEFLDRLPRIDEAEVVAALGSTLVDWDAACADAVAGGPGDPGQEPPAAAGGSGSAS